MRETGVRCALGVRTAEEAIEGAEWRRTRLLGCLLGNEQQQRRCSLRCCAEAGRGRGGAWGRRCWERVCGCNLRRRAIKVLSKGLRPADVEARPLARTQLADGFCFSEPKTLGLLRCCCFFLHLPSGLYRAQPIGHWKFGIWDLIGQQQPPRTRAVGRFERLGPMATSPRAKQAVVLC